MRRRQSRGNNPRPQKIILKVVRLFKEWQPVGSLVTQVCLLPLQPEFTASPSLPGCRPCSGTEEIATATHCYLLCTILPLEPSVCRLLQSFVCDILSLALHLLAAGLRTRAPFHEEVLSGRSGENLTQTIVAFAANERSGR